MHIDIDTESGVLGHALAALDEAGETAALVRYIAYPGTDQIPEHGRLHAIGRDGVTMTCEFVGKPDLTAPRQRWARVRAGVWEVGTFGGRLPHADTANLVEHTRTHGRLDQLLALGRLSTLPTITVSNSVEPEPEEEVRPLV